MGGQAIPNILPVRKFNNLASNKSIMKRSDNFSHKFGRSKPSRFKNRNERPDIYLQGEQVINFKPTWTQDMDVRFIEAFKQKIRRTSVNQIKVQIAKKKSVHTHQNPINWVTSDDSSMYVKTFSGTRDPSSRMMKKPIPRTNLHSQTSQRQKTVDRDVQRKRGRQIKLRVQPKIQIKKEQPQKVINDELRRKQLFYINQRDMNGIKSQSFIIVEYPINQIITGYYYRKAVQIASLTKIMTFYTSLRLLAEHSIDPQTHIVEIDSLAAKISGTSAQLYQGDKYTIMQLFYALMLPSGNDAALALSRWGNLVIGEGEKGFMNYMNRLAQQIGMKNSCFGNPHGLPHPQSSCTAQDVSILILKGLEIQTFRQVIKCQKYKCWTENSNIKRQVIWQNTNKLLRRPGFQGIKTGVTATAGPCLATLYNANGRYFIIVLLRTNKLSRRFKETRWLLGLCLRKLNNRGQFNTKIGQLFHEDTELDSDNSEDQQQFIFQRNDLKEFQKRKRILMNQL